MKYYVSNDKYLENEYISEPEQKQLLEKAAASRYLTVSEYLLQLALDIATG
ncbi:DUF1778 domain-containing protein [Okeania sp.]|uniref:type II toxin -antitoxin system TacA 1-like antitoxin n=1 Tax=Okeania sp. TaxID=3100323 RepID=UPI002B4B0F0E|nr:DUF1778 domain-containing protein [Okeania sp.]MEB3341270.1 DUF1778 domain-containing protein [Okeania sp.]